jgi:hypothetical protein
MWIIPGLLQDFNKSGLGSHQQAAAGRLLMNFV